MNYTILKHGDLILKGDEFWDDGLRKWMPAKPGSTHIGGNQPVRREVGWQWGTPTEPGYYLFGGYHKKSPRPATAHFLKSDQVKPLGWWLRILDPPKQEWEPLLPEQVLKHLGRHARFQATAGAGWTEGKLTGVSIDTSGHFMFACDFDGYYYKFCEIDKNKLD
jgi:hypothetical protein